MTNLTRTKLILCAALGYISLLSVEVKAQNAIDDQKAAKLRLLKNWQKYFQSLRSLEYSSREVIEKHPLDDIRGTTTTYEFMMNGSRYRVATKPLSPGENLQVVRAFNGKQYQELKVSRSGSSHLTLDTRPIAGSPYGTVTPVLLSFNFAYTENDPVSIAYMQGSIPWKGLMSRITSIKDGQWQGKNGQYVTIKGTSKTMKYTVFVDRHSQFPLYTRREQMLNTRQGIVSQQNEVIVINGITRKVGTMPLFFPTKVEGRTVRAGKERISGYEEVIGTIKINQPIQSKNIFTIPRSQATTLMDYERQRREMAAQTAQ